MDKKDVIGSQSVSDIVEDSLVRGATMILKIVVESPMKIRLELNVCIVS